MCEGRQSPAGHRNPVHGNEGVGPEERRRIYERPALELPLPEERPRRKEREEPDEEPSRVIVIDL